MATTATEVVVRAMKLIEVAIHCHLSFIDL